MGVLRWLLLSALCIAVRGESDPHPGTVTTGDTPGMAGRWGAPHRISSRRTAGQFESGEVVLLLVGPQNLQFLQDTTEMGGKECGWGGMCFEGLVELGA